MQDEPPAGPFSTIDSGERHTCALNLNGSAYCWGHTRTARGGPFTAIHVGGRHQCHTGAPSGLCSPIACGIRPGGEPQCWVPNIDLGAPSRNSHPRSDEPVSTLDIGFRVCTAPTAGGATCTRRGPLDDDEKWWWNERRTIPGNGDFLQISVGYGWIWPPPIDFSTDVVYPVSIDVAGSGPPPLPKPDEEDEHACGLRPDGDIECWGDGPAGHSDDQYDESPVGAPTEPPDGPFVQVAAGQWHTCALRADGTVACWYSY